MISFVLLVLGFGLLIKGADYFVHGASSLAAKLGIPSLIIGLTVVAFGTSAPELAVSLIASFQGSNEIVLGNVLGSNIFNLLVVIGMSAVMTPLIVSKELLNRDWIISILGTTAVAFFMFIDQNISQVEGCILLALFSVVLGLQIRASLKSKKGNQQSVVVENDEEVTKESNSKIIFYTLVGLIGIVLGAQFAVNGASEIARMFHISETIIGLTIVAIGTSLPELVTSVVASKKGENEIAIGNVIGSNIFNILLILGVSTSLNTIPIQFNTIIDTLILIVISIALFIPAKYNKLNAKTGICMVLFYACYMAYVIIR